MANMEAQTAETGRQKVSNRSILVLCLVFFCAMIGMAYAAVPLYTLFCRVTGYNGTTQRVEQYSDVILDKTINVTFDANTSNGLNWDFQPIDRKVSPKIGETVQVMFKATNRSSVATTGTAVFNVTPMEAGAYFKFTPGFRVGGAVGLTDKTPPTPKAQDEVTPRVRLETTFKF